MRPTLRFVIGCVLLTAAFAAGTVYSTRTPQAQAAGVRRVLYWHDPMHPGYRSDQAGIAPDCGMQLEPVYADDPAPAAAPRADLPAGTIQIPADTQQRIGVQISAVERSAGPQQVRTVGRVAIDQRRVFRINAATPGWIVDAAPSSVGSVVGKDELLATFYAREFLGAQQAFLYALDARDRFRAQNAGEAQMLSTTTQLQSAADTLKALGMSATQMEELSRTRDRIANIAIRAPESGFIITRNVSPGQRFDIGTELFVIADLRRVWVLADMFQHEANFIRAGRTVRVSLPHQAQTLTGRVSEVLPQFDPSTRTLKVRIDVDNPDYSLRPDMFVDVQFPLNLPPAITVPSDAVLDAGLRQTVFVDLGNGYFERRRVETGWRFGDRVEIRHGLMPGERVVTAGNFLIDSESRLKAAAAGIRSEPTRDPICGMDVDQARAKAAGLGSVHAGRTHYFCSPHCKEQFDEHPAKYAGEQ